MNLKKICALIDNLKAVSFYDGAATLVTDHLGNTTTYVSDLASRLTLVVDSDLRYMVQAYDGANRQTLVEVHDADNHLTSRTRAGRYIARIFM